MVHSCCLPHPLLRLSDVLYSLLQCFIEAEIQHTDGVGGRLPVFRSPLLSSSLTELVLPRPDGPSASPKDRQRTL